MTRFKRAADFPYQVKIYMKENAGGFVYGVNSLAALLEHIGKIVATGYRRNVGDDLVWYPISSIDKVKGIGPGLMTEYLDEVFRT